MARESILQCLDAKSRLHASWAIVRSISLEMMVGKLIVVGPMMHGS
jgi:hypothetical protein